MAKLTGFSHAHEDRPTPPEVYNWRVYVTASLISLTIMAFGYDTSYIGTTITLESFRRDFGLNRMSTAETDTVTSNITSVYSVGAFFGALFAFFSVEVLGRRWTVTLSTGIFIIGAILTLVAAGHLSILYAGRVISGFGMGCAMSVTPTYISELSPPAIRGRMTGFFESYYQVGSLVGFWINYGITRHIDSNSSAGWHIGMAVQLIPPGIVALCLPVLRESPTWLLKKGRDDEAREVISYMRNLPTDHHYITEEVDFVKAQIVLERAIARDDTRKTHKAFLSYTRGVFRESITRGVRNRFALVAMMCCLQPWSGAVAINYYSPTIFRSIGLDNVTLWTGVYGIIKSTASIVYFSVLIDLTGRKWPWIISCVFCAISMYYLAAYIAIAYPTVGGTQNPSEQSAGKAATAMIMIFGFMWSFGANGLPLVIASEIFPSSLRSVSGPFASMNVWLWSFVTTKSLPSMYTALGYGLYIFFGTVLVVAAICGYFFIYETKGLRLDQMDLLFGGVGGQVVGYDEEIAKEATFEHRDVVQPEPKEL